MTFEYQIYTPRLCKVGEGINNEGIEWICVKECMLIGSTIEDNIPVFQGPDGPVLNDGQLVRVDHFKTLPKLGQTYTEIMTLAEYEMVEPKELEGKELKRVYQMDDTFIAICHDKTYIKFFAAKDWDNDSTLDDDCLTLSNLYMFNLIDKSTWEQHLKEALEAHLQNTATLYDSQFREAMHRVGEERAKELMNNYLNPGDSK